MNNDSMGFYAVAGVVVWMFVSKALKGKRMKTLLPDLLSKGAVIIDVRSEVEYSNGANPRSVNIPLDRLSNKTLVSVPKDKPVVLCCASGMRSGAAAVVLKKLGYREVVNAGSWKNTF